MMNELDYRTTRILKALGNPLRYRILLRLLQEPATPTRLARELQKGLDAISRNLGVLRSLDLVCYRPRSHHLVYEVKHGAVAPFLAAALDCARIARVTNLTPDPGVAVPI